MVETWITPALIVALFLGLWRMTYAQSRDLRRELREVLQDLAGI